MFSKGKVEWDFVGERHVGSISKASLCFYSNRVSWCHSRLCLFNNFAKLLKEPGVQEEKTAERIVQDRSVWDEKSTVFSCVFHRFTDLMSLNIATNKYLHTIMVHPQHQSRIQQKRRVDSGQIDHSWFSCLLCFKKEDALGFLVKIFLYKCLKSLGPRGRESNMLFLVSPDLFWSRSAKIGHELHGWCVGICWKLKV